MAGDEATADVSSLGALAGITRSGGRSDLDLDDSGSTAERVFQWVLVALWLAIATVTLAYGLPYYRLALAARDASPLDEALRPSGLIGQGYGIIGTLLIMVGVGMYSFRKRLPFLRRAGALHLWLEAHIFLCTLGPFLVLLHTTFKFGGIVAISFWSMMAVAFSGLFGRYVYGHIPRAIHDQRTSLAALHTAKDELTQRLETDYPQEAARLRPLTELHPPTQPKGLIHALILAVRYDLTRRVRMRQLRGAAAGAKLPPFIRTDLVAVVGAQSRMEQQHVLLQPFQRLFHYWHIFHLPLTVVMFVILAVHVGVSVMLGYTWIF